LRNYVIYHDAVVLNRETFAEASLYQ